MDEIKKIHSEIEKENDELIKKSTIGIFLLKNHEEIFNNMETYVNEMASNIIRRCMMLHAESDGIDLVFKLGKPVDEIYSDENFKIFLIKINEYFEKIQSSPTYEKSEQYEMFEKLIYDKFRLLKDKLK
jgi:hypothetical protein